jgi:hypothetical protein
MTNLETLKQQAADMEAKLNEMKAEIERLGKGWEMKCPYKDRDKYYIVNSRGLVKFLFWDNCVANKKTFNQGHIFPTKQAALLEAKRRNLLTRFRAFRDECNGDWKPDWSDKKWDINYTEEEVKALWTNVTNSFSIFGYFKNSEDAERAIELFGDEIKELFVDCEAQ